MIHGTDRPYNMNRDYQVDYMTDAGRVITNNMSAIHYGDCFSSHCAVDDITYGTPWDILFQTPNDRYCHIKFIDTWLATGYGYLQILEDIESYTGGWVVDKHNRRRPSIASTTTTAAPTTTTAPTTTSTTSTSTTTTTNTTTTSTTTTNTTTTSTTPVPTTTTTETPHEYLPGYLADFRLTWSEEYRFIYNQIEAQSTEKIAHSGTSNVIVREGGLATIGANAVEIDAYRYSGILRTTADRWMDHEWIFKKNKLYLFRLWRISPIPTTTSTTAAPTTTTTFIPL